MGLIVVAGTPGFDISCDKKLLYHGSPEFSACPVNDHGEWNVYTKPAPGQKKCISITLTAHGDFPSPPSCNKPAPKPATPAAKPVAPVHFPVIAYPCSEEDEKAGKCIPPKICKSNGTHGMTCEPMRPSVSSVPPAPPAPKPAPVKVDCDDDKHKDDDECKYKMPEACPTDLDGEYEFPHLIIPVDQAQPEKAFGNQFNGTITDSVCTAYNFDVHPRFAGKACSLVFLFPEQQDLETSAYDFSGSDSSTLGVFILHKPVEHNTTWSTLPRKTLVAKERIYPGKKMNIIQKECPAGLRVGVMLCGKGFSLEYFQDFNPSPIGLYIRAC